MSYHEIPTITRRTGKYAGNVAIGCASLMMRIAVTGMGIAIIGTLIAVLVGGAK